MGQARKRLKESTRCPVYGLEPRRLSKHSDCSSRSISFTNNTNGKDLKFRLQWCCPVLGAYF